MPATLIDEPYLGRLSDPRPRLYQRIAAEGGKFAIGFKDAQRAEFLRNMRLAEIIWADDVVQSLFDSSEPEKSPWDEADIVTPPFSRMWIEYGYPPHVDPSGKGRCGALVLVDHYPTADMPGSFALVLAQAIDGTPPVIGYGAVTFEIGIDGRMTKDCKLFTPYEHEHWNDLQRSQWRDDQSFQAGLMAAIISMLHTKNVTTDEQPIDARHAKHCLRKFGEREGGYKFRTVNVWDKPLREYIREAKDAVNKGLMPLHKCRGGYAKYGPEFGKGLLFGKYSGRFFHPPHMRGKAKNGITHKDYRVAVPA